MTKKRFYWITSDRYPDGYSQERAVMEALRARGHAVVTWVWDRAPLPPLGPEDRAIVRSPDYFEKPEAFATWLAGLPERGLHNSKRVLAWNSRKDYLRDLEEEGVRIIATRWAECATDQELAAEIDRARAAFGAEEIIVKPVFSASAYHTYRLAAGEYPPAGAYAGRPAMIQPFRPEILEAGETSLIYFRGKFSHGVRKLPIAGDFRTQESYGGKLVPHEPDAVEREFADGIFRRVFARFPEEGGPLYGRADFLRIAGVPQLMELELFEPDLFLHHAPGAKVRFLIALESVQ